MTCDMSSLDSPAPVPGFETPESFRNAVKFGQFFRRLIPLYVVTFLLAWWLTGAVLGLFGVGSVGWVLGLVVAAALACAMYVIKKKQFAGSWSTATLEISPKGVVSFDRYVRTEIPWERMHAISSTQLMDPLRAGNKLAGAAAAASFRRSEEGLIGAGTWTVSPVAPRMLRSQIEQNERGQAIHPDSGQPLRAITLTHYDPDWRTGRIGKWIKAYRPDLLA
jgi:hypothetical protein